MTVVNGTREISRSTEQTTRRSCSTASLGKSAKSDLKVLLFRLTTSLLASQTEWTATLLSNRNVTILFRPVRRTPFLLSFAQAAGSTSLSLSVDASRHPSTNQTSYHRHSCPRRPLSTRKSRHRSSSHDEFSKSSRECSRFRQTRGRGGTTRATRSESIDKSDHEERGGTGTGKISPKWDQNHRSLRQARFFPSPFLLAIRRS